MNATSTMEDANPYSAPDAELAQGQNEVYTPSIFAATGRIGRLRYLAYGIGISMLLMVVMVPLAGMLAMLGGEGAGSIISMVVLGVVYIAALVISVLFAKRRLNDLNRSGWWFLLMFVPIANLLLTIYLIFFPGTEGNNNFGPAPCANSLGVQILGWSMPVLFIIGVGAAVMIPAMQGF